jgi:glycogen debranching enzyme
MELSMEKAELFKDRLISEIEDLKSPQGYLYAGKPKFEGLFGRDSLIASWQLLQYDSDIAKNTLLSLAEVQGTRENTINGEEPGKIPHEYYPEDTSVDWYNDYKKDVKWLKKGEPVYFSVDSTLLFIIVLAKYYRVTKDKDFLLQMKPHIHRALDWVYSYGLNKGLLMHKKLHPNDGLDSQSWKDGIGETINQLEGALAIVEVQGYSYLTFKEGAFLAEEMGDLRLAKRLIKSASKLKEKFYQNFWDEDKQYFIFGLDSNGKRIKSVMSNAGHLLFTGILNKKEANLVVKRLFASDMWTPYGIRTHSTLEPEFNSRAYQLGTVWPHDNWIISQGLLDMGYYKEYQKVTNAMLKAYTEMNYVPELYGVTKDDKLFIDDLIDKPCFPQAWSSGALLNVVIADR